VTLVDLTVPITVGMPAHPVHFGPSVEPYARHADDGYRATRITLSSHLGTHVDAPSHFVGDGATLEDVRIEDLVGPAEVVRLHGLAPRQELMPEDVPPSGATRILLHTGWAAATGYAPRYFTEYPSISAELARELVARGVVLVGLDTPSVDHDPGETHHILLGAGMVIVENLAGLERIPDLIDLIVLPLPIVGGDGCPARAIASFEGAAR
jgi:arylformamidase